MELKLLVDAAEFWPVLQRDIQASKQNVYVQTLSFEGDQAGLDLANEMKSSAAEDRRIIVDNYTKYILNDTFLYSPKNFFNPELRAEHYATKEMIHDLKDNAVNVKFVNPMGPFLFRVSARNHKKVIVADNQAAFIGGINFSDHNFAWHDLMLRIPPSDLLDFLKEDFLKTWQGSNQGGHYTFDDVEVLLLDGRCSEETCGRVFEVLDSAKERIFIESPYFSFPFYDPLKKATERGVKVQLVAPAANNWGLYDEYTRWESARCGIDLLYYPGRMNHLKAILVDDRHLLIGSSNFDYFSHSLHQEIILVISNKALIEEFQKRIVEPDLKLSRPAGHSHVKPSSSAYRKMKFLFKSLAFLNKKF